MAKTVPLRTSAGMGLKGSVSSFLKLIASIDGLEGQIMPQRKLLTLMNKC